MQHAAEVDAQQPESERVHDARLGLGSVVADAKKPLQRPREEPLLPAAHEELRQGVSDHEVEHQCLRYFQIKKSQIVCGTNKLTAPNIEKGAATWGYQYRFHMDQSQKKIDDWICNRRSIRCVRAALTFSQRKAPPTNSSEPVMPS